MTTVLITCPIQIGANNPFQAVRDLIAEVEKSGKKPLAPILAIECANGSLTGDAIEHIRQTELELIKCRGADEIRFVNPSATDLRSVVDTAVQFSIWDRSTNTPRVPKRWS